MIVRVDSLIKGSVLHGPGLRYVVVTQGCHTNCPGCNAPQTHDPKAGRSFSTQDIAREIYEQADLYNGVTFTGGEPFLQADALSEIANAVIRLNSTKINQDLIEPKTIIVYTGYTYEQIQELIKQGANSYMKLLCSIDYLIDGKYDKDKVTDESKYVSTKNQRIIDVKETLRQKEVVEIDKLTW